jgi:hypothetical protein
MLSFPDTLAAQSHWSLNENTGPVPTDELVVLHYPNPFSAVTQIEVNAKSPFNAQLLHVTVYNTSRLTSWLPKYLKMRKRSQKTARCL